MRRLWWFLGVLAVLAVGELTVTLVTPDGERLDVTEKTPSDSVGAVTEALEGEELLELTHSDMDFEFHDPDGDLAGRLRLATLDETWEVLVERYNGKRRGKWDLVFSGILDVPRSLEIDRKERRVSAQAFSYSKLLERVDVESLRRDRDPYPQTLAGQVGTGTTGVSGITVTPGFNPQVLKIGDRIAIDDGTNREEHTVVALSGATPTVALTLENLEHTYTAGNLTLLTPWPWHQTVEEIAESLLSSLGISVEVDIENAAARVPFASGFDPDGINVFGATDVSMMAWESADFDGMNHSLARRVGALRYLATSPSSGFTVSSVGNNEGDWTPYLDSQPGSLEEVPEDVQNGSGNDTQLNMSPVQDGGVDWVAAYDHAGGHTYTLRHSHDPINDDPRIRLFRDGTLVVLVAAAPGNTGDQYHTAFLEWFDRSADGFTDDIAVVSSQAHDGARRLGIVNLGTDTLTDVVVGAGGGGGGVRTLADRRRVAVQQAASSDLNQSNIPADIGFWKSAADGTYLALDRTIENQPVMQMWTMRSFGDFIACMYLADAPTASSGTGFQKRATRCRVWRWDTLAQVADFQVAEFANPQMFATRVMLRGVPSLVIAVANFMWVLSPSWLGTVPYINFDDISAAAALKDVAVLTFAYLHVDQHKIASLRDRGSDAGDAIELDPDDIIEWVELPLTTDYVSSVEVEGRDAAGQDFSIVVGNRHDSADRASIKSTLIRDTGLAESVGERYRDLLSGRRIEHQLVVKLGERHWHAMDLATFDDGTYRVISVETDLEQNVQSLRLIQVLSQDQAEAVEA